jgi:hypothetical protein
MVRAASCGTPSCSNRTSGSRACGVRARVCTRLRSAWSSQVMSGVPGGARGQQRLNPPQLRRNSGHGASGAAPPELPPPVPDQRRQRHPGQQHSLRRTRPSAAPRTGPLEVQAGGSPPVPAGSSPPRLVPGCRGPSRGRSSRSASWRCCPSRPGRPGWPDSSTAPDRDHCRDCRAPGFPLLAGVLRAARAGGAASAGSVPGGGGGGDVQCPIRPDQVRVGEPLAAGLGSSLVGTSSNGAGSCAKPWRRPVGVYPSPTSGPGGQAVRLGRYCSLMDTCVRGS